MAQNKNNTLNLQEKQKLALQILSLQADLKVPRTNMSLLLKMPENWLKDNLESLKKAEAQELNMK